ncbi:MAG TPA: hypothetical protein VN154_11650 [Rhizomicrobium sp.]|nr:hypothetical protein [Rhizomicrobium sp.]
MKKIPFWPTIGSAYRFAFEHLATIIALIWLPLIVLCIAGYFAISHYFDGILSAVAAGNRYAAYAGIGDYYLFRIGALFLESVMAVAVMRQALAPRGRSVFVHFWLGPTELRMFGAFASAALVLLAIEIFALFLLFVLLTIAARTFGAGHGAASSYALWAMLALFLVTFGGVAFVWVRLSFLLVPVTVAENRIDLIRAWELTRGSFWRAFLITTFTSVPAWLLYLTLQIAFVGFAMAGDAWNAWPFGIDLTSAAENVALKTHGILALLPYFYGAWFLVRPLTLGLTTGAAAAAYRALVPEPAAVSTQSAGIRTANS